MGEHLRSMARDRAEALMPKPPLRDPYADAISRDLDRIAQAQEALFDQDWPALGSAPRPAAIVLFTAQDCAECAKARAELDGVVSDLGLRAHVIDIANAPMGAALMQRLTLDVVPSYVMPDRLIRGQMPDFVLRRYLAEPAPDS